MTNDDSAATAAHARQAPPAGQGRDPLDEALRHLGADILNEPVPDSLLALLESVPAARRA